jgi:hypothetical protein
MPSAVGQGEEVGRLHAVAASAGTALTPNRSPLVPFSVDAERMAAAPIIQPADTLLLPFRTNEAR